ncbi:MAG: PHB depolymerase family esterase [Candidatus Thermoplasmatota archaeon]|nr:PHB depolymerase family esterase [Candidatus Thermoplasmatota archaeon]
MNEWFYPTERGSLIPSVVIERDMRWISSTAFSLILFSSMLTGCLSNNEESQNDDHGESDAGSNEYYENGAYFCVDHGGLERCWQQHIPEGLDPGRPVPLLIDMHGYASDSTNHKKLSSFDRIADEHGAIVVYPDGVLGRNLPTDIEENQAWNAGWCCAHSAKNDVDDVGFIERVVNFTLEMHNVDSNRIYASGWSNGCAMAQRLAMESSHIFAAVGCMAMYLVNDPTEQYSPIPIMEVHGFLDQIVLYESTILSIPFNEDMWTEPEAYETGAVENMFEWAGHNDCSGGVKTFEMNALYSIQGFDECANNATVKLMTIFAAQHNPYSNDNDDGTLIGSSFIGTQGLVESSEIVWDFLILHNKSNLSVGSF